MARPKADQSKRSAELDDSAVWPHFYSVMLRVGVLQLPLDEIGFHLVRQTLL